MIYSNRAVNLGLTIMEYFHMEIFCMKFFEQIAIKQITVYQMLFMSNVMITHSQLGSWEFTTNVINLLLYTTLAKLQNSQEIIILNNFQYIKRI